MSETAITPIRHQGDFAAYLRQLGVKEVTAQELETLIRAQVVVSDLSAMGPGPELAPVHSHGGVLIFGTATASAGLCYLPGPRGGYILGTGGSSPAPTSICVIPADDVAFSVATPATTTNGIEPVGTVIGGQVEGGAVSIAPQGGILPEPIYVRPGAAGYVGQGAVNVPSVPLILVRDIP